MTVTLFGITNCDTVRKARKSLEADGTPFLYHDFRKDGLSASEAQRMIDALGAEQLLNKRGTTWRQLSDVDQRRAEGDELAALLADYPALIKRPVWQFGDAFRIGFKASESDALRRWAKTGL